MAAPERIDVDLRTKFLNLENDFIDAFFRGSSALSTFVRRLSHLQFDAKNALADGALSSQTIQLTRTTAFSIQTIADNFRTIEPRTRAVDEKRQAEISEAFQNLSLKDVDSQQERCERALVSDGKGRERRTHQFRFLANSSTGRSPGNSESSTCPIALFRSSSEETLVGDDEGQADGTPAVPPHVQLGFDWLQKHLHHPYPSHKVKERIVNSSSVQLKTVDSWFANMRRRIGWNSLSKTHFRGVRALTIDYAQRVLMEGNKDHSVPDDIVSSFLRMKADFTMAYESVLGASKAAKDVEALIQSDIQQRKERPPGAINKSSSRTVPHDSTHSGQNPSAEIVEPHEQSTTFTRLPRLTTSVVRPSSPPLEAPSSPSTGVKEDDKQNRRNKRRISVSDDKPDAKRIRSLGADFKPDSVSHEVAAAVTSPISRKRRNPTLESDCTPSAKRTRNSPQQVVSRVINSDNSLREDKAGMSGARQLDHSSSEQVHTGIINTGTPVGLISTGDSRVNASDWSDNSMGLRSLAVVTEYSLLGEPACDLFNVSGIVDHAPVVPSEQHEYSVIQGLDDVDNPPAFGRLPMAGEMAEDPLAMLCPEDFGEDFAEFPGMPDFNIDWNSIPPPSLDSFLLPSEFSFSSSLLTPANCGSNVETQLSTSFGSDSTLADPSDPSLSFLEKP